MNTEVGIPGWRILVNESGDEVEQIGVRASKESGRNVDGTCCAVGLVVKEGSFQGGKGMRAEAGVSENWVKLGGLQKFTKNGFFRKLWVVPLSPLKDPSLATKLAAKYTPSKFCSNLWTCV